MYLDFFNLKTSPFNITCDPEFFFESSSHREALGVLSYGIQEKKGVILLTGEVGTGKTMVSKILLSRLDRSVKVSAVFNNYFNEGELLRAIVEDFGLRIWRKSRLELVKRLNNFLIEISLRGGNAVLIIDEAQNLTALQLEQVRLLSNLETSKEKLLQIVLVGQPELVEKLNKHKLRQIRQRIFVKYHIRPLEESEVKDYIEFRLKKVSAFNIDILPECYKMIYEFSGGIPRLINLVCDRAMLYAFLRERSIFDEEVLRNCIEEVR